MFGDSVKYPTILGYLNIKRYLNIKGYFIIGFHKGIMLWRIMLI